MAVLRTISYLLLAAALTVAGVLAFAHFGFLNYLWLMVGSMFISIIGAIISGIFLSTILFPKTIPIMLAGKGKETNKLLQHALGKKKRTAFSATQIICMLTFSAVTLYSSSTLLENRIAEELRTHGKTIKVGIIDTHYTKRRSIDFVFLHNNNLYHHSLGSNTVQIGDSIYVIYSARLPHLVRWAN